MRGADGAAAQPGADRPRASRSRTVGSYAVGHRERPQRAAAGDPVGGDAVHEGAEGGGVVRREAGREQGADDPGEHVAGSGGGEPRRRVGLGAHRLALGDDEGRRALEQHGGAGEGDEAPGVAERVGLDVVGGDLVAAVAGPLTRFRRRPRQAGSEAAKVRHRSRRRALEAGQQPRELAGVRRQDRRCARRPVDERQPPGVDDDGQVARQGGTRGVELVAGALVVGLGVETGPTTQAWTRPSPMTASGTAWWTSPTGVGVPT